MKPVLKAIYYLHNMGIIHRDLKLENIMFKDKTYTTIKILDFGLSIKAAGTKKLKKLLGTPLYLAPEVIAVFLNFIKLSLNNY